MIGNTLKSSVLFFTLICTLPLFSQNSPVPFSAPDSSVASTRAGQATAEPPGDSVAEFELLEIDGSSRFTLEEPRIGDSLDYIITVEWVNPKVPFFVLAPESLTFSGFKKTGVSTDHKKISKVEAGKAILKNRSKFTYRLKAQLQGPGRASSTRLPYYTAVAPEKEYLNISANIIDILPARIPLSKKWYVRLLFWIALLAVLIAGGVISLNLWKKRKQGNKTETLDIQHEMKDLKSRLHTGQPKSVLLQMEALSTRFLAQQLGSTGNFNTLLPLYLENDRACEELWLKLQDDFELAKFGGGHKAPHEMLESYRNLKVCLNLKEEEEHE